jgi:CheY-like chemotaxis protein
MATRRGLSSLARRMRAKMAKRVLIIDNDRANRISLGGVLERFEFIVTQASSGAEAISIFNEDPGYDLVVVNIEMPGMNGVTTVKMIRQLQRAKRPFIIGFPVSDEMMTMPKDAGFDFLASSLSQINMTSPALSGNTIRKD